MSNKVSVPSSSYAHLISEDPMLSNINQEATEGIIESQHVQVPSRACTKRDSCSISSFCFPSLGSLYTLLQLHHLAKPRNMEKEVPSQAVEQEKLVTGFLALNS